MKTSTTSTFPFTGFKNIQKDGSSAVIKGNKGNCIFSFQIKKTDGGYLLSLTTTNTPAHPQAMLGIHTNQRSDTAMDDSDEDFAEFIRLSNESLENNPDPEPAKLIGFYTQISDHSVVLTSTQVSPSLNGMIARMVRFLYFAVMTFDDPDEYSFYDIFCK